MSGEETRTERCIYKGTCAQVDRREERTEENRRDVFTKVDMR